MYNLLTLNISIFHCFTKMPPSISLNTACPPLLVKKIKDKSSTTIKSFSLCPPSFFTFRAFLSITVTLNFFLYQCSTLIILSAALLNLLFNSFISKTLKNHEQSYFTFPNLISPAQTVFMGIIYESDFSVQCQ